MLFNSYEFAAFFLIVYLLYLVLPHRWQNKMLLAASYIFYGSWDWRFLSLILFSTVLDYICGIKIYRHSQIRIKKMFLALSLTGNLAVLGFFKYFNFFSSSLCDLLSVLGLEVLTPGLNIVLPVGISFYTFQTMSYTIDIYRGEMKPTHHFLDFALFVAFFPQLVAGPIERAKSLLPQILKPRKLRRDWIAEGFYLIVCGLFLKLFVADNLAQLVDPIFAQKETYNGATVILGAYAFAFQIYCDFAGYSHIARGLARLMGIHLMNNFNLPYFSTNPVEFWRRWHISLSTWLRDYLYIPLGGNRKGKIITLRNLMITMLLGGLWHGAAWTFVIWGFYQGLLLVLYQLAKPALTLIPQPRNIGMKFIWFAIQVMFFFNLTCLGWLIFRSESLSQLSGMLSSIICNFMVFDGAIIFGLAMTIFVYIIAVVAAQIIQFVKKDLLVIFQFKTEAQILLYMFMLYCIVASGIREQQQFIYFQF